MAVEKFINCANTDDFPSILKLLVVGSDGETPYITCENTYEGFVSLLKQLLVLDDDGNLALSVTGCGGGTATEVVIGDGTDGSWRWIRDGANNLLKQKRKAGVWVTVAKDTF